VKHAAHHLVPEVAVTELHQALDVALEHLLTLQDIIGKGFAGGVQDVSHNFLDLARVNLHQLDDAWQEVLQQGQVFSALVSDQHRDA